MLCTCVPELKVFKCDDPLPLFVGTAKTWVEAGDPTYMLVQSRDAAIYEQIVPRRESQTERKFSASHGKLNVQAHSNPIYGQEYEVPVSSRPDQLGTGQDGSPDFDGGCYEVPVQTRQAVPYPPSLDGGRTRPPKSLNVYEESQVRPQATEEQLGTMATPWCYEIPMPSLQKQDKLAAFQKVYENQQHSDAVHKK